MVLWARAWLLGALGVEELCVSRAGRRVVLEEQRTGGQRVILRARQAIGVLDRQGRFAHQEALGTMRWHSRILLLQADARSIGLVDRADAALGDCVRATLAAP